MLTLERVLNFLIMVYLTSVYFRDLTTRRHLFIITPFDTGVPRSNCNLVIAGQTDRAPYSWNMVKLFSFGCHVTDRAYVSTYVRTYVRVYRLYG